MFVPNMFDEEKEVFVVDAFLYETSASYQNRVDNMNDSGDYEIDWSELIEDNSDDEE